MFKTYMIAPRPFRRSFRPELPEYSDQNLTKNAKIKFKKGFGDFREKAISGKNCKPEISATRCTIQENHQKLSILVIFWRFFKIFGKTLSGNTLKLEIAEIGATRCGQFTKIAKNCQF